MNTLEGGDIIMKEVEGHQIEEMTKREVIQEVEGHQIEDPLMRGPPDDGGPPGNGRHQSRPGR